MERRLFLPLASPGPASAPTVDAVRKRLGGRASTEAGAGELVGLGAGRTGVVIFVRGEQLDVWLPGDVVRRVRRADTRAVSSPPAHPPHQTAAQPAPASGTVARELLAVALDARVFAALHEGQRVGYQAEGGLGEGVLVEKCRFGGLVERGDRTVLGVGFRRLVPAMGQAGEPVTPLS